MMPPLGSSPARVLVAAGALALAGACGGKDTALEQRRLAAGFEPAHAPASDATGLGPDVSMISVGDETWLKTRLDPSKWVATGLSGVWRQARLVAGEGMPRGGPGQRLLVAGGKLAAPTDEDAYRFVPIDTSRPALAKIESGIFCAITNGVFVARGPEDGPPTRPLELYEYLERGHDDGVSWRVPVGAVEAEGFPLLSGEEATLRIEPIAEGSALSFWTTVRTLSPSIGSHGAVRVQLDGETLYESELELDATAGSLAHLVPLPATDVRAQLTFALTGPPLAGAIHQPRIRPQDIGRYGEGPRLDSRPDLVLVVADTYRADNLKTYGGDPRIAPELDALAARARVYTRAWATSAWTLPSHASLFSGLLPPAAGCMDFTDRLGEGAETLAETLRAVGYRTVAVTDRGFVSRDHGLAQGFEWFQEVRRRGAGSLLETAADVRAQVAADDGRPLFLFVQTYRAHTPYEVTAEASNELDDLFPVADSYKRLDEALPVASMHPEHEGWDEFLRRSEALYRGASRDTSRGLGQLVDDLEASGLLRNGHLFLTSDHGEAFGEHALFGHGSSVHETQVHIPLFHIGTGVKAETIREEVSLLDLPPTLVSLAGLVPPREWTGKDLRKPPAGRLQFSFVGNQRTGGHQGAFAARRESRKLYFLDSLAQEPPQAFDLDVDPHETTDRFAESAWAASLRKEVLERLPSVRERRVHSVRANLSAEAQQQLDELGYAAGASEED